MARWKSNFVILGVCLHAERSENLCEAVIFLVEEVKEKGLSWDSDELSWTADVARQMLTISADQVGD